MFGFESALTAAGLDVGAHLDHLGPLAPELGGAGAAIPAGAGGDWNLWRRRHVYAANIADCSQSSNMRRSGSRQQHTPPHTPHASRTPKQKQKWENGKLEKWEIVITVPRSRVAGDLPLSGL